MASVFTFAGSAVALVPVAEKSGKDHFQDVFVAKGTGKVLYLNLEMRGFMFSYWTGTHTKEAQAGKIITIRKYFTHRSLQSFTRSIAAVSLRSLPVALYDSTVKMVIFSPHVELVGKTNCTCRLVIKHLQHRVRNIMPCLLTKTK